MVYPILPNLLQTIQLYRRACIPVIFTCTDGDGGMLAERWNGDLIMDGTAKAELMPELEKVPEDMVVGKNTYSAFRNTGLEEQLREMGVEEPEWPEYFVPGCNPERSGSLQLSKKYVYKCNWWEYEMKEKVLRRKCAALSFSDAVDLAARRSLSILMLAARRRSWCSPSISLSHFPFFLSSQAQLSLSQTLSIAARRSPSISPLAVDLFGR
ncbi:hypothetical protein SO802_013760 [Lithocarpus litseifolius]|uniref:Isochorismatase-like domain-containing protein n=1 Tax=Lithocarpus litseifolius TaxID=425828 RepID=A0AAW2D7Y5_9ROSI